MIIYRFGKSKQVGLARGYIEAKCETIPNVGLAKVFRLIPAADLLIAGKYLCIARLRMSWLRWEIRGGVVWRRKPSRTKGETP